MTIKLGIIMDDIATITVAKDTTFAFMLEAQRRGWEIYYLQIQDMYYVNGQVFGKVCQVRVVDHHTQWYQVLDQLTILMSTLDVILMRKDPPVDMEYFYATYLLELIETTGTKIFNAPKALQNMNEKFAITQFLPCCVDTLITSQESNLRQFIKEQKEVIFKPLDSMGGELIFRVKESDPNLTVIIEAMTQNGKKTVMVQRYIPEIIQGDKRIILINGKPIDFALLRVPAPGETRANLVAGGTGVAVPLTERDYFICEQVGKTLRDQGLIFVGLDVIGDYLTEINVTSPTCVRQLDQQCQLNISATFFDVIESTFS